MAAAKIWAELSRCRPGCPSCPGHDHTYPVPIGPDGHTQGRFIERLIFQLYVHFPLQPTGIQHKRHRVASLGGVIV